MFSRYVLFISPILSHLIWNKYLRIILKSDEGTDKSDSDRKSVESDNNSSATSSHKNINNFVCNLS